MRKLVVKMSMSLDGFVAGGSPGSNWMFHGSTPDSAAWVRETLEGAGTHAVGRGLFESWIQFWPTSDSPMAGAINTIPKVVFAREPDFDLGALASGIEPSSDPASWGRSRVASGDLASELGSLKEEPGEYILAQGGVAFCRSLVQSGLVDEYRFAVLPVALGSGDGLFTGITSELDLELVSSTVFSGGAMGNVFRPKGLA